MLILCPISCPILCEGFSASCYESIHRRYLPRVNCSSTIPLFVLTRGALTTPSGPVRILTMTAITSVLQEVGQSLPPDTPHVSSIFRHPRQGTWNSLPVCIQAVSVSLPTWQSCVGYEEGEQWVLSKMKNGYPRLFPRKSNQSGVCSSFHCRFFIDPVIASFADAIIQKYGSPTDQALLFPSRATAARCIDFFKQQVRSLKEGKGIRAINLYPRQGSFEEGPRQQRQDPGPVVVAVVFPRDYFKVAKTFWQHTGDGVSSRRAEVCHKAFEDGQLITSSPFSTGTPSARSEVCKGPQRYRKQSAGQINVTRQVGTHSDPRDYVQFVEERFGRNLDTKLAASAKLAIRRRIAGALTADVDLSEALEQIEATGRERGIHGSSVDDVYLYPSGMSSIFNMHRIMMKCRGPRKSICFGSVDRAVGP